MILRDKKRLDDTRLLIAISRATLDILNAVIETNKMWNAIYSDNFLRVTTAIRSVLDVMERTLSEEEDEKAKLRAVMECMKEFGLLPEDKTSKEEKEGERGEEGKGKGAQD